MIRPPGLVPKADVCRRTEGVFRVEGRVRFLLADGPRNAFSSSLRNFFCVLSAFDSDLPKPFFISRRFRCFPGGLKR